MNIICLLVLLVPMIVCHGHPIKRAPQNVPQNVGISVFGDKELSFNLKWRKMTSSDASDPIAGYKVKIWKVKKVKVTSYEVKNKQVNKIEYYELPPMQPDTDPNEETVEIQVPAYKNEITYTGLKEGITYEVGLQAITSKGIGSKTSKLRILLAPKINH